MAKDDPIKPDAAKAPLGGLKGLQANPDEMAQAIAFEVNTGHVGEVAAKAVSKLTGEKLAALISEAKADREETEDSEWSVRQYIRDRFRAREVLGYETRLVMK